MELMFVEKPQCCQICDFISNSVVLGIFLKASPLEA